MADQKPDLLGGTAIKPEGWDRTGWEAFKYMLYNPKTGEILTRTPLSWAKITFFYCIYYSCLAAFWIGCLHIFFLTLPEASEGPRWTQDYSLIGVNPGVGIRPQSADHLIDSQMFVVKVSDRSMEPTDAAGEGDKNVDYAQRVKVFLGVYENEVASNYRKFDLNAQLGPCASFPYGFVATSGSPRPCIFLKFNKIWGWSPKAITDTAGNVVLTGKDGDEVPAELLEHIKAQDDMDQVWIDCQGRYPADRQQLEGEGLKYYPESRGIPIGGSPSYFPFEGNTKAYQSPLVAIQVSPNQVDGQLIHVECRAYFQGVVHNTKDKIGLVQFEVQILPEKIVE